MKAFDTLNMSNSELLMELRQQGVEHLGQVRLGIVETDGDLSLYFHDEKDLCPGLSVLPYWPIRRQCGEQRPTSSRLRTCCTGNGPAKTESIATTYR